MNTDLFKILHSNQSLGESKCKCIMKQILEGVKAMHALNVFHRDIKPGNILVSTCIILTKHMATLANLGTD